MDVTSAVIWMHEYHYIWIPALIKLGSTISQIKEGAAYRLLEKAETPVSFELWILELWSDWKAMAMKIQYLECYAFDFDRGPVTGKAKGGWRI